MAFSCLTKICKWNSWLCLYDQLQTGFNSNGFGNQIWQARPPIQDLTLYSNLTGAFQYLTFTCPDNTYAIQQICLYMHDPRELHFTALKRILHYICETPIIRSSVLHIAKLLLTRMAARSPGAPNPVTMFFQDTTSYHDHPNVRILHLAPMLRLNIAGSQMLLRKLVGSVTFFLSYTTPLTMLLFCIVLMWLWCLCLLTQFNINGLNILRSTFILFEITSLLVLIVFFMFLLNLIMRIYSPKVYHLLYFWIFSPIGTFVRLLPLQVWGAVRLTVLYFII